MHERQLIPLSSVTVRQTQWLWQDRIPLGAITIVDGDPGQGKSTLCYDLAARVTMGRPMPESDQANPPASVVLLQAEDGLADVVAPRLLAAGADQSRVWVCDRKSCSAGPLTLPEDLPTIEKTVVGAKAQLVIIDPLAAFVAGSIGNDRVTRKALAPLAALAERQNLAVLVVRHLTKSQARKPLYAGSGSIGIIGIARSAFLVGADPTSNTPHQHVLTQTKGNLAEAESLSFRTVNGNDAITVQWQGRSPCTAADVAAYSTAHDDPTALQEAEYFLFCTLAEGPLPANEVLRVARAAAVPERTLRRAKGNLRVRSVKHGGGPGARWSWVLPEEDNPRVQACKAKALDELMRELCHETPPTPPTSDAHDRQPRDFRPLGNDGETPEYPAC